MADKDFLTEEELTRHFNLHDTLLKFHNLFTYNEGDDRAIVIIGGSFIDLVLEHILLSFLPEDKEVDLLFKSDGMLATYGNKIKLAYCLGLIEKVIRDDLKIIGKIRNKFAHDLYASFDNQQIQDWCKELRWHKISMMTEPPVDATIRDLYQVGVNQIITYLNGIVVISRANKRVILNSF